MLISTSDLQHGVYNETCVIRGPPPPPTLFESDFIAFSCSKIAGCLSEEELEIVNCLNGSFVAVFSSCLRTILIKAQFQVCHEV